MVRVGRVDRDPADERVGDVAVSMRSNVTAEASASAFLETNTRPIRVPAHSVPSSLGARVVATT